MLSRFLKAANALLFGQIISRLGSFILIPIYLARWTPAVYGEWLAMFAAIGYLSTLDIGMQVAAVNRLTQAYARRDLEEYRRVQRSALALYILVALAGSIVLLSSALSLPLSRWIGLRITPPHTAATVILLLGTYLLWSMPGKVIVSTYQTMGNLARAQWINNVQQIAMIAGTIALLAANHGMVAIAALQPLGLLGVLLYSYFDLRLRHPEIAPGIRGASFRTVRELLHPSLMFALIALSMLVYFQGQTLLVSIALGGVAVAVLSVSRTLVVLLRTIVDAMTDAACPDIARLYALDESARLRQLLRILAGSTVAVVAAGAAAFWWEGASVIEVWTRGRLHPDPILLRLLLLLAIGQSVWLCAAVFSSATNHNRSLAFSYVASNASGILCAVLLVPRYGVRGVPIALLIGEAAFCYHFVVRHTCRMISMPYASFARKLWTFVIVVTGTTIAAAYPVHAGLKVFAPLRWGAVGIVAFVTASAITWGFWLDAEHRHAVLERLRYLLRGRTDVAARSLASEVEVP